MSALSERLAQPDMVGKPDWAAAEDLNAPDPALPTTRQDVATSDAREVLLTRQAWPGIVLAAEDAAVPVQARGLCVLVRDTMMLTTTLRTSDAAIYTSTAAALDGLIALGLLDAAGKAALLALADRPQSWAEANGVEVDQVAVSVARGRLMLVQE
jgi:hypothetical protein